MKLLLLSDIHGNLSALDAVINDAYRRMSDGSHFDGVILLGDNIDYGMRSNEVVAELSALKIPIICSVWGNHENAILTSNFKHFSSERGRGCAQNTAAHLNDFSRMWLTNTAAHTGAASIDLVGKRILVIHGNVEDPLWGTLAPSQCDFSAYDLYDVVISGHSHIPHIFTVLLPDNNPKMRNKKVITFINPGSVGQPRNHDPRASYVIWDTESGFQLNNAEYDIELEQSLYDGSVDVFYRDRLTLGV